MSTERHWIESWIGEPLLFGRIRHGFSLNFETLDLLRLDGNGAITGGHHHNESIWAVGGDGQLRFLRPDRRVSTDFQKIEFLGSAPILLGPCLTDCTNHFLLRHTSLAESRSRILYAASTRSGHERWLEKLLRSLDMANVDRDRTWITISGEPASSHGTVEGRVVNRVREDALEFTALLDLARSNPSFDYVMLLHDTCEAGPQFSRAVGMQNCALGADYTSMTNPSRFNIGLYSAGFLQRSLPYLESLDGISPQRAAAIEADLDHRGMKSLSRIASNFIESSCIPVGRKTSDPDRAIDDDMVLGGGALTKFGIVRDGSRPRN